MTDQPVTTLATTPTPLPDTPQEKAITKITKYLENPAILARYQSMFGNKGAASYINSVLLLVADNRKLQECSAISIHVSALRAATLKLSVDPGIGQAYLVPYKGKATLIIGYKGLYDLAVKTGRYVYINVGPVYEGEEVPFDRLSGRHETPRPMAGTLHINKNKIIGWLGAFQMYPEKGQKTGYSKTLYMTHDEIHEHAKTYNPNGYESPDSPWDNKPANTLQMERKTVLRTLIRKWGYIDPADAAVFSDVSEDDGEIIEGEFSRDLKEREGEQPKAGEAQLLSELGFDSNPDPIDNKTWDAYLALCNEADALDVPYSMPKREATTKADLIAGAKELRATVNDAKAQAEAGTGAQ